MAVLKRISLIAVLAALGLAACVSPENEGSEPVEASYTQESQPIEFYEPAHGAPESN